MNPLRPTVNVCPRCRSLCGGAFCLTCAADALGMLKTTFGAVPRPGLPQVPNRDSFPILTRIPLRK